MEPHELGVPVVRQIDVAETPPAVFDALEQQIEEAGGPWRPRPEDEGSIGRTMFDTPASADGTVTILLPREHLEGLPGQSLVRIQSDDGRHYLGVVVEGPFAEPDGLRADAPILVTVTVRGGVLMPKFHGRAQVELIGEEAPNGAVVPPRRRPLPNSPVFVLTGAETADVLRTHGDVRLGLVEGPDEIEVKVPSEKKSVLPRHLGILGTTGGGKSTTVSGLIAQLQQAEAAVVLIDTEGEYTALCDPAEDPAMLEALDARDMVPRGVDNTHILHLVGREVANPAHPSVRPFMLSFAELSPYAVMEILALTEAQQVRFLKAYDATKLALERLKVYPASAVEKQEVLELDELEAGYPKMTLAHLYDMVLLMTAKVAKDQAEPPLATPLFQQNRPALQPLSNPPDLPGSVPSWRALLGRLGRVKRLGVFDNPKAKPPDYGEMLQPGRVTIIDLSDTDSPLVNNLVIAQLLRGIHRRQDENYRRALEQGNKPTLAMVFIEEAHEFLSRERIGKMEVLFQQVARIARRGRKRWLGLGFITQLPQHLPDEVLGLINNWVLHKINDANVVSRLRKSIGGIDDGLWNRLPALAPGQAIVSCTSLTRPLLVAIDPTPCRLLMVD